MVQLYFVSVKLEGYGEFSLYNRSYVFHLACCLRTAALADTI